MLQPLLGGVGAILTLHHVRPPRADAFQPNRLLEVSPQFLDDVLAGLRRADVDIVTLDEMHRRLTECDFRRRFVCLTFDDGYRDNLQHALPILRRHGAPFTLYVPTSFPDRAGELWWLTLEAVIAKRSRIALTMDGEDRRYDCDSPEAKYELYEHIYWWLRSLDERGRIARRGARARVALRRRRHVLQRPVHDLARDRRDRGRSARDHRRAHGQSRDAAQGERRGGAQRDAPERGGDRGGARHAPRAFQLSGRRPHLGGAARVCDRGRARLQDRGDDAAGRAVSRACRAFHRAAAHLAQRRVPALALRQGAALGRRDRAVEQVPAGRTRPKTLSGRCIQLTTGIAGSTQPSPAIT